ncbi:MAG TPA: ABC transporter substrate-binding protein [Chloroflexota bacterium]|nr:ABC transporter substrate-binding protein [Chloroflexota bacterium]
MSVIRVHYRDVDRTPYLYVLKYAARRYGLELDLQRVVGPTYAELLVDGATDFLAENYWGLQIFRARGVPLLSVATSVTWMNETLLVHPDIHDLQDLRGKRFAVRGVGPSELVPILWLHDQGLGADVTPIVVSEQEVGRWGHWKRVLHGDCHGCLVTNLYADEPIAAGLRVLPIAPYGMLGNVTLTTTEGLATQRCDDVLSLVRAAFDAQHLFKYDRVITLDIMRQEPMQLMRIPDEQRLERVYEILSAELADQPVPRAEAIANTHRMVLGRYPELANFNPLLMWDLSFAREVLKERSSSRSE